MSTILEPQILEDFCLDFIHRLGSYRLSYYLRDKGSNQSKNNAIHSSIIWTRESVKQINRSYEISGGTNYNIESMLLLISFIDILLEATEQIYRVLYKTNGYPCFQETFCFHDAPDQYASLDNRFYFKEIRSIFSVHPVNLREPKQNVKTPRYADIPLWGHSSSAIHNRRKGDFYSRLWNATNDDTETIYFPLYFNDLFTYAQLVYGRFPEYRKRLKQIANRHV